MARSVFVTGAYGLLGSWMVKGLLERGERVTVLRRDETARSGLSLQGLESEVDVVSGELRDASLMNRAISDYEVDTVFHLAAQTLVGPANRSPVPTFENNIQGTWTLLEACRINAVERTVVAASDKAYGNHDELPYRETHALRARYPYDVSKAATDMIARTYNYTYGMPVAVTRFANLYGGGDLNASRLVPEAISAALSGRSPVIRSDGSPERDFLYVEDAVRAYLAISDRLDEPEFQGEAFNAGGDAPHSVGEVVQLICEIAASDVVPDVRGEGVPSGEIDRQYVDSTKLREMTGWAPEFGLREGLERTVEWYRSRPDAWTVA
jgi:CDP-glucose 4,6-dehydratase